MDNLDFLETEEEVIETQQEEAPVEPVAEPAEPVEPEKPKEDGPIMVPLAALQEVRDELKTVKARLAEEPMPEPQPMPDVIEDPEAFTQAVNSNVQTQIHSVKLAISRKFAEQAHGADLTNTALEWGKQRCAEDPVFNMQVMQHEDPVGFAVQQYQREQIASQVTPSEFEQFKAWQAAQAQVTPQQQQPVEVPKTIAGSPSAGGVQHIALGQGAIFDDFFQR